MNEICRTCLQEVGDGSVMFYLDAVDSHSETITIRCKLADCVPEMDLDVVPNAFICNTCFESLMVAHEFKNKCLETEGRIQSYIEQMGYVLTSVDLREIVQQNKVQLPTSSQIATATFTQTLNYPTAKESSSSHIKTTLYDSNKNPIKIKDEPKEESLDLKNLQCDTRAFFAVPKIAQLLAEGDKNLYKCGQCNYRASSDFELKSHEETHQSLRLEKCDFFNVPKIAQLLTEGNGTSSHKCHHCSYVASSDLDLQSHEETHRISDIKNFFSMPKISQFLSENNGNPSCSLLQCTQCTYTASSDLDLQSHEENHLVTQKLHKCTECDYSAPKRQTLIIHMRKHAGEKSYHCNKCGYRTQYRNMLMEHTESHTEDKPYKCTLCNFSSMYGSNLSKHIRLHSDEKSLKSHKPYKCPFCDYSSSHKTNFNYHIRIHSGEKPYKCKLCEYRTSQKSNLHVHSKSHAIEKPFKCLQCNYTTAHSKSLTTHLRIHTSEKPYSCTFCSYNTFTKANLIKHIITHTEKESTVKDNLTQASFQCTVCRKAFGDNNNLERHMKYHSKKDSSDHISVDSQTKQDNKTESSHLSTTDNDNKDYCQDKTNCESAVKNQMII